MEKKKSPRNKTIDFGEEEGRIYLQRAVAAEELTEERVNVTVLGDMFELGPFAPALHTGVGECLGKARIDCLVAVGELAEHIAQGARNSGVPLVYHCKDKAEAKPVLDQLVRPGSTILVKASRGMELEELTAYLLSITPEAE